MFTNENTTLTMPVQPAGYYGNGYGFGGWNNDIISLAIIAMIFGWGNFGGYGNFGGWGNFGGYGNFGGFGNFGGMGPAQNYILGSDVASLQRQLSDGFNSVDNALDAQNNGICNLGYTALEQTNATQREIMQGNYNLGAQLADCCCRTQQNIKDTQYLIGQTGGEIQGAIKDASAFNQAALAQTRYEAAAQNCETLRAVDRLGDRILGYMANEKNQALKDENFALKLQSSQIAQNQYLIGQLAPKAPVPAFVVPNPFGYNGGYGYNGTTIA